MVAGKRDPIQTGLGKEKDWFMFLGTNIRIYWHTQSQGVQGKPWIWGDPNYFIMDQLLHPSFWLSELMLTKMTQTYSIPEWIIVAEGVESTHRWPNLGYVSHQITTVISPIWTKRTERGGGVVLLAEEGGMTSRQQNNRYHNSPLTVRDEDALDN